VIIRTYIPKDFPRELYDELENNNIEIAVVNQTNHHSTAMSWRYLIADENIPWMICDADDDYNFGLFYDVLIDFLRNDKKEFYYNKMPVFIKVLGCRMACKRRIPGIFEMIETLNNTCNVFACDELWLTKEFIKLFDEDKCDGRVMTYL
jgi:hypothetical protein